MLHLSRLPSPRASLALLLGLLALAAMGCRPKETTVQVRGRYLGSQFGGLVAVIHHEDVPGVMPAMRMSFRVENPEELAGLERGSAISFELQMQGDEWQIGHIQVLPDSVRLNLPSDSTTADSTTVR